MYCDEAKELIYEYIFDELEEAKRIEVKNHIDSCNTCKKEYLELKKVLVEDMQFLKEVEEEIVMPKDLPLKINNKIYGNPIKRFSRFSAAACLLVFLFYAIPVAAYYAIENTALNKYINFDKGLVQEMEQGKIQMVEKSTTLKDITLRVDGVIRKKEATTLLITVKIPEKLDVDYAYPDAAYDTIVVKDQLGKVYRHKGSAITLESSKTDGEATMILDVEPLKFWAYKLSVRVTALQGGILEKSSEEEKELSEEYDYVIKDKKNIYGSWVVNFYIDRSHKK